MIERVAFVSHPRSSAFMRELLDVVGDAVQRAGMPVLHHTGVISDVDDGTIAFVVIPHEYAAVAGPLPDESAVRTIAFCVEHPGTATFDASMHAAASAAARFDINADGARRLRSAGLSCERFVLGYSPRWDRRDEVASRDVDVLYLGTADPRRLALLADLMPPLMHRRTQLLLPPHEPMTRSRPDFLMGEAKWRKLAASRVLVNLHRESATAFEWVRALEAICNGTVVVSEPSTDLWPLVPGEHVLVAEPVRMAAVIEAVLVDERERAMIAAGALDVVQQTLDMNASAVRLAECAAGLPVGARRVPARVPTVAADVAEPLAEWVPSVPSRPDHDAVGTVGTVRTRPADDTSWLDVVCVSAPDDGPLWETLHALPRTGVTAHVALDGTAAPDVWQHAAVATVLANEVPVGRGRCRTALLEHAHAPWVLVIDAGDVVASAELDRLREYATDDLDVVYPMAATTPRMIVNALIPEVRRLERDDYLTRGYLVRRAWLDQLGGFDASLDGSCDRDFWLRSARANGRVELLKELGAVLWPRRQLVAQ